MPSLRYSYHSTKCSSCQSASSLNSEHTHCPTIRRFARCEGSSVIRLQRFLFFFHPFGLKASQCPAIDSSCPCKPTKAQEKLMAMVKSSETGNGRMPAPRRQGPGQLPHLRFGRSSLDTRIWAVSKIYEKTLCVDHSGGCFCAR